MGVGQAKASESPRRAAALMTLYRGAYDVEVASTSFGPGLPGLRAYHSSVRVDDVEYSFSMMGIFMAPFEQPGAWASHQCYANKPKITKYGPSAVSGQQLVRLLQQFFQRDSYDLLRKNCNSFADMALYCLLDLRLNPNVCGLEKIGHAADKKSHIIQLATDGGYRPNPAADSFSPEKVIHCIDDYKTQRGFR
mmetsp:Transcript_60225/g.127568  ORF Transcript_60225/g.127568 Transcript_60225/m.127568 type:complete len:193 (-) Transcript_60225:108-686(-)